jgi:hypothetical protein
MKKIMLNLFFLSSLTIVFCQSDTILYYKNGTATSRAKSYNNAVKTIKENLALPLTQENEFYWQDAFYTIQLLNYNPALVIKQIDIAASKLGKQSTSFQKDFFTAVYKRFPVRYFTQAKNIIDTTNDYKLLALAGEYILADENKLNYSKTLFNILKKKLKQDSIALANPHLISLARNIRNKTKLKDEPIEDYEKVFSAIIPFFFEKNYLLNNVIVFSFQRKNRNYPGLATVRDTNGNLIKIETGDYFAVPQLARSINNLPSYLTNGNTPCGVFRMYGFDRSKIAAIGTTENLQLALPVETTKQHFFNDTTITNNNWTIEDYKNILPKKLRGSKILQQTYYAGLAGRNEIIAHGTTVNPQYYEKQTYYPYTPTEGCLCTKEIWSTVDGKRLESDQQKLIDAVKKAGGANGYLIVIELEDVNKPVTIQDILPYLKQTHQK